jgi:hypothetical protein
MGHAASIGSITGWRHAVFGSRSEVPSLHSLSRGFHFAEIGKYGAEVIGFEAFSRVRYRKCSRCSGSGYLRLLI